MKSTMGIDTGLSDDCQASLRVRESPRERTNNMLWAWRSQESRGNHRYYPPSSQV